MGISKNRVKISYAEKRYLTLTGDHFFYRSWRSNAPEAVIILLHEFGEDGKRYEKRARMLAEKNIAVYALDMRGHGESTGDRYHAESLDRLVRDLEIFVNLVRSKEDLPHFILSKGYSSIIALKYIEKGSVEGLILLHPQLKIEDMDHYLEGFKAKLYDIFLGKKILTLKKDVKISLHLLRDLIKQLRHFRKKKIEIKVPMLVISETSEIKEQLSTIIKSGEYSLKKIDQPGEKSWVEEIYSIIEWINNVTGE